MGPIDVPGARRLREAEECLLDALLGLAWYTREGDTFGLDRVIALAQGGYGWGLEEDGTARPTDIDFAFMDDQDGFAVQLRKAHGGDEAEAAADAAYRCVRDYECFVALCPDHADREAVAVSVVRRLERARDRLAGTCPGATALMVGQAGA